MYQVVKNVGLGLAECPTQSIRTEFIFHNKEDADRKADELWKDNTTEKDRNSGWCAIHYTVEELKVI